MTGAGTPTSLKIVLHGAGVAGDHGLDVGVDHGCARALVLLDLGQHLGRDRHEGFRCHLRDEVAGAPFVGAVYPSVQVADRDRVDVLGEEALHGFANRGLVERRIFAGPRVDSRRHLPAQVPGHQGGGLLPVDVVEPVHPHAADLENVAEALGGDEPGGRAGAGDDGVGGHRRPVGEGPDRRGRHSVLGEGLGHALPDGGIEVRRRGEDLLRHRPAPRRHQHDVRKGAAYIHAHPIPSLRRFQSILIQYVTCFSHYRSSRNPLHDRTWANARPGRDGTTRTVWSGRTSRRLEFAAGPGHRPSSRETALNAGSAPSRPRPPSTWPYPRRPCRPRGHARRRPSRHGHLAAPTRGRARARVRSRRPRRSGS